MFAAVLAAVDAGGLAVPVCGRWKRTDGNELSRTLASEVVSREKIKQPFRARAASVRHSHWAAGWSVVVAYQVIQILTTKLEAWKFDRDWGRREKSSPSNLYFHPVDGKADLAGFGSRWLARQVELAGTEGYFAKILLLSEKSVHSVNVLPVVVRASLKHA